MIQTIDVQLKKVLVLSFQSFGSDNLSDLNQMIQISHQNNSLMDKDNL